MTMFTEGYLQAYERMMQQSSRYCRDDSGTKHSPKSQGERKPAAKGGERYGSRKS